MWPEYLRSEIRRNPLRRAEVLVYDLLKQVLPDNWTVWYSRPWLGLTSTGAEKDGEADFILAHPDRGFLCLEVKGGAVSYDPATDSWTSRDREGIIHPIKNPIGQARSAKYQILEKLKASRGWQDRRLRIRHGVIFTDCLVPQRALGADAPREIFCDASDFRADFRGWLEHRLGRPNREEGEVALGDGGIELLNRILASPISLRVPASVLIEDDERTFRELTVQQFHLIEVLSEIPRAAIAGAAGTGKTIIAIEKARRSAAAGHRTLFTCFNRPLAAFVTRQLEGENVEVSTFHSVCSRAAAAAGLKPPPRVPQQEVLDNVMPGFLIDAAGLPGWEPYDTIVVDEGQDFMPHWWAALDSALANDPAGHFYIFYDDNQSVYGATRALPENVGLAPFRLSRNLRNTQLIHTVASLHYRGGAVEAIGPRGADISWIPAATPSARARELAAVIRELCGPEHIVPEEIGVLVLNEAEIDLCTNAGYIAGHPVCRMDQLQPGCVSMDTIRRFKGLERQVVVLVASEALQNEPELAYVALSRPRSRLYVIGSAAVMRFLNSDRPA